MDGGLARVEKLSRMNSSHSTARLADALLREA
jgi:hypothetical protein